MAQNVTEAFNEFMKDKVNLDPEKTKIARSSRDWLVQQILTFPEKNKDFPEIYAERNIFFGSFDRRVKKRPLDDMDLMICLKGMDSTYAERSNNTVEIFVPDHAITLKKLCHDGTNKLNSKKVINLFVKALDGVPQYQNAEEIRRNLEAVKLKLSSYDWNFDIVPCFFTLPDDSQREYYIIPNGEGHWLKTDPRMDKKRIDKVNTYHNGQILQVIRAIKYWNKRPTMPLMGSYLLENMILDYYSNQTDKAEQFVDKEIVKVLKDLRHRVHLSVIDPKGIQGDLNTLSHEVRKKIAERADLDWKRAIEARQLEDAGDQEKSIKKWREIFGEEFPTYEKAALARTAV